MWALLYYRQEVTEPQKRFSKTCSSHGYYEKRQAETICSFYLIILPIYCGFNQRRHWNIKMFPFKDIHTLRIVSSQCSQRLGHIRTFLFFSFSFFFFFFLISWRLITLQYCSGFCHTLTWISHGFKCVPHPAPPPHLPLHPH